MKRFLSLIFSLATIAGLESGASSLHAQEQRPAVIVIRHAQDVSNSETVSKWDTVTWKAPNDWRTVCPNWPNYSHTFVYINNGGLASDHGETVPVALHALSGNWISGKKDGTKRDDMKNPLGELQALSLADSLAPFLDRKFAPIGRVITMDPREDGSTANPFDTVWPFLSKAPTTTDLYLVKKTKTDSPDKWPGIFALIDKEKSGTPVESGAAQKVLPADGKSALICWTGEGLSGTDGILAKLYEAYGVKAPDAFPKGLIGKCASVWVFYKNSEGKGVVEKYAFKYKEGDANGQNRQGSFELAK